MEQQRTPTGPKPSNSYLKYGGLGIQLFGGIGLGAWVGHLLDNYLELTFPAFLLSFVLLTFTGLMYVVYNQLKNE